MNTRSRTDAPHPVLEIGDPFLFMERQAYAMQTELRLPTDFIPAAIDIVKGAFGEEWLRDRAHAKTRATPIPLSDHPLGTCFAVAGPTDIVEILELAVYIKRLARVPRLDVVVRAMRDRYGPGLLQLAYAYRFQRLGATSLELEPEAAGGRYADISFELSGAPYLVECYIPEVKHEDSSQELQYSTKTIFDALGQRANRLARVCIRLRRPINAEDRKRIQQVTVGAIRTMGDRALVEVQDEAAAISIEDISDMTTDTDFPRPGQPRGSSARLYGDAFWGMSEESVAVGEIPAIRRGAASAPKPSNRVFVWRASEEEIPQPFEARVKELVEKISDKLAQTRRDDDTRRIVVASIPEAVDPDSGARRLVRSVYDRLLPKHRGVAAVVLTARVWTTAKRHQYRGFVLFGEEGQRLPIDSFNRLQELEGEADILQDWR